MKILIIGATGLLARPVFEQFEKDGHAVRLFSRSIKQVDHLKKYDSVQGDVFDKEALRQAMNGCDAVHITLSKVDEAKAVNVIAQEAKNHSVKLISYVSGASVREENRWFPMIDAKYRAERIIIESGISYFIFRPGWFFESLQLFVRNNKASIIGKQPHPSRWIAAGDFGRMVANAFKSKETHNSIFFTLGKDNYLMKELLEEYCRQLHPEIKKVSSIPTGMLKFIGRISANQELVRVASMFRYFEKVHIDADTTKTYHLLGEPQLDFQQWMKQKIQQG